MKKEKDFCSCTPIFIEVAIFAMLIIFTINCSKEKNPTKPSTSVTVTDIDGNVYNTIKIGIQLWIKENLKVKHYRNGDAIPNITDITEWSNLNTGAYCIYDNTNDSAATYGHLYNWYAVNDNRKIAPVGWHVPTNSEWQTLVVYLGGESVAGGKMKEQGISHWLSPNTGATDESGFSGLPGGYRYDNGYFSNLRISSSFWSATEGNSNFAWYWDLSSGRSDFRQNNYTKQCGFSVRLVRD